MKLSYLLFGILATVTIAAPARAQSMMGPAVVKINGCAAQHAAPAQSFTDYFGTHVVQSSTSPMLMIDFQNNSNKPIESIEFAYLQDNKVNAVVRDVGTFAPGSVIMHAFTFDGVSVFNADSAMSCVPLRVRYADGTMWNNPAAPHQ
ncbi:MAG TPA: hypothetical protein VK702_12760 [Candidatus Acidoferrum sp.]|jgi:hypothetical protein|nr:hypothetical protein [Candidatus Acidoferrum sp.]